MKLEPRGGTSAGLALAEAFKYNDAADTIYFLSDGKPTSQDGSTVPTKPILRSVKTANRYRRIIIHTLGFGSTPEAFLRPLAERNNGTYQQIVGPPIIDKEDDEKKKGRK